MLLSPTSNPAEGSQLDGNQRRGADLSQGLQGGDEAAVWDLDVWEVPGPVAAVQRHLGLLL